MTKREEPNLPKKKILFWGNFKSQGKEKNNNFIQFLIDSHMTYFK
jgi:hypothetical protein